MSRKIFALGLLLGLFTAWSLSADTDDESDSNDEVRVELTELNAKLQTAIMELAGNATKTIFKEQDDDGEVVHVEWQQQGVAHEAEFTMTGELIESERDLPLNAVPAAVRSAVEAKFPQGAEVSFERKTLVVYEAEAMVDGQEVEVHCYPNGELVEEDDDDEDDDDEDDDDEGGQVDNGEDDE